MGLVLCTAPLACPLSHHIFLQLHLVPHQAESLPRCPLSSLRHGSLCEWRWATPENSLLMWCDTGYRDLKAEMETTLLCMLRENAPPLLYFFLVVVVVILSSVKKHPPPPAPDGTKAPFSVSAPWWGRVLARTKSRRREGGSGNGQLGKMTQCFSTWMFFICSSFHSSLPPLGSLSNVLCPPPPLSTSKLRDWSLFPLPGFFFFPTCWPLTRKKEWLKEAEMNTNC